MARGEGSRFCAFYYFSGGMIERPECVDGTFITNGGPVRMQMCLQWYTTSRFVREELPLSSSPAWRSSIRYTRFN